MINSAPKIMRLTVDLHKHLIDVPAPVAIAAELDLSALSDLIGEHWSKPVLPEPHRLMANIDTVLEENIFDVA